MDEHRDEFSDDLLIGAKAIAAYFGTNERAVYYWAKYTRLPFARMGSRLVLRISRLEKFFDDQERRCFNKNPRQAPREANDKKQGTDKQERRNSNDDSKDAPTKRDADPEEGEPSDVDPD